MQKNLLKPIKTRVSLRILLLDNYDSFTYNLFHYLEGLDVAVEVHRNDAITVEEAEKFTHFVLSPGPGLPEAAGRMPQLIAHYHRQKPMLGVCLGMQALALFFGARLYNPDRVMHGVASACTVTDTADPLFTGVPRTFQAGRYHSWAVDTATLPDCLRLTATDEQQIAMAMRHTSLPIWGVQFHPESVMTPEGKKMLENWLRATGKSK